MAFMKKSKKIHHLDDAEPVALAKEQEQMLTDFAHKRFPLLPFETE